MNKRIGLISAVALLVVFAWASIPMSTHTNSFQKPGIPEKEDGPVPQHCSVIYASDGETALGGNNEDGSYPILTRLWFIPPEDGKFGYAVVGHADFTAPEGAVNDQGLFYDALSIDPTKGSSQPGKTDYLGGIGVKIIAECATVKCALDFIDRYNFPGIWNAQVFIGDKHGDSAIIEPQAVIRKEGTFQVATNFLQSQVPPTERTDYRYLTATKLLQNEDGFSVDLFRQVLDAVHQQSDVDANNLPAHTLYSTIYELKKGDIYLYYFHNFYSVVKFNLKDELAKGLHSYDIPSLFPSSPAAARLGGKTPEELEALRVALPRVPVAAKILDEYQGHYQAEAFESIPEGQLFLKSEKGRLVFRQPFTPWIELIPQSNTHFIYFFSDRLASLHQWDLNYQKDASGQEALLQIAMDNGAVYNFRKVDSQVATTKHGGFLWYQWVILIGLLLAAGTAVVAVRSGKFPWTKKLRFP